MIFAAKDLDPVTYQVTGQLKVLSTALFSVILLQRSLTRTQWFSLVLLAFGACLVNIHPEKLANTSSFGVSLGLGAAVVAVTISGYAGIYVEGLLKNDGRIGLVTSANGTPGPSLLWLNIQLSGFSAILASFQVVLSTGLTGIFDGFNEFTWIFIFLSAIGGLITAVVVKHTDSVVKVKSLLLAAQTQVLRVCVLNRTLLSQFLSY